MKVRELRPCDGCGGPLAPVFSVVTLEPHVVDTRAVRSLVGLAEVLGGVERPGALAVAEALAPDDQVTKTDAKLAEEYFACTRCGVEHLGHFLELARERRARSREPGAPT